MSEKTTHRLKASGRVVVALALLTGLLIPLYLFNFLSTADGGFFANYQRDSEGLVIAKIVADATNHTPPGGFGLAFASDPYGDLNALQAGSTVTDMFSPYPSQIGVLGYFYSASYSLGLNSLGLLHALAVGLFAVIAATCAILLRKVSTTAFSVCFVVAIALSPWMVVNVRNLYWSPWTWFLPFMFGLLHTTARTRPGRALSLVGVGCACVLRFAAGFEFVTSFALMAAFAPLIALAFRFRGPGQIKSSVRDALTLLGVSVFAFIIDLLILGSMRGSGDVLAGVRNIYQMDVLRRTYPELGYTGTNAALDASPIPVLNEFLFHGYTNLLAVTFGGLGSASLGAAALPALFLLAGIICVLRLAVGSRDAARDTLLLVGSAAIPASWYVLAPAHSAAHPHIVFVLLDLLFVGCLLFICVTGVYEIGCALANGSALDRSSRFRRDNFAQSHNQRSLRGTARIRS